MTKPLLTFMVPAFNHERFVRDAIESAFAQMYSPLEVVLSDDCSPDGTFEWMQKAAAEYKGPHQVILNRNPVRLSLGGHLNRLVEISHGELLVCAAGDDISLPHRCSQIHEAWEESGRRATSIHSDYIQIDENGRQIEKIFQRQEEPKEGEEGQLTPTAWVRTLQPTVFGCTHAFSRKLFQTFGDVPAELIHEDDVLALRSILAGGITYIDQPLVKYRVHGENVYITKAGRSYSLQQLAREEARVRSYFFNRYTMYATFLKDLESAKQQGLIKEQQPGARREAECQARRCALFVEFFDSGVFAKVYKLIKLRGEQLNQNEYRMLKVRLLPKPLLLRARLMYNCIVRAFSSASRGRAPNSGSAHGLERLRAFVAVFSRAQASLSSEDCGYSSGLVGAYSLVSGILSLFG